MDRLNFNVLQQFWTIAKSYWSGDEKWQARGLLLGVVLCLAKMSAATEPETESSADTTEQK